MLAMMRYYTTGFEYLPFRDRDHASAFGHAVGRIPKSGALHYLWLSLAPSSW